MMPATQISASDQAASTPALDRKAYEHFLPLVRRVALRTAQSLPPNITYDDVLRSGWSGLVDALRRRGDAHDKDFEVFAAYRIRLAVLEFLKSQDPKSRQMRTASSRISDAIGVLSRRLKRPPEETEVAGEIGLDLAGYLALLERISEAGWVRLELTAEGNGMPGDESGSGDTMGQMSEVRQLSGRVEGIIRALPNQYQIVLGLYYEEQCAHEEIADVLGVTQSRACQMHAQAVHLIRGQLSQGGTA